MTELKPGNNGDNAQWRPGNNGNNAGNNEGADANADDPADAWKANETPNNAGQSVSNGSSSVHVQPILGWQLQRWVLVR